MSPFDIVRHGLSMNDRVINSYIGDLEDADLLVRPVPGMNHIAWQLGHLIGTERHFCELIKPGSSPALPADFQEGHGRKTYTEDDPSKFYTREKYQQLWKAQREATLAMLETLSETDLDRSDPEKFPSFAPSVGALLSLLGAHPLMHCGQFVAVRRLLDKPVVI